MFGMDMSIQTAKSQEPKTVATKLLYCILHSIQRRRHEAAAFKMKDNKTIPSRGKLSSFGRNQVDKPKTFSSRRRKHRLGLGLDSLFAFLIILCGCSSALGVTIENSFMKESSQMRILDEADTTAQEYEMKVSTNPFVVEFLGSFDFETDEETILSIIQLRLQFYLHSKLGPLLKGFGVSLLGAQISEDSLDGSRSLRGLQSRNELLVRALMMTTLYLHGDADSVALMDVDVTTDLVKSFFKGESVEELKSLLNNAGVDITSIYLSEDDAIVSGYGEEDEDWKKPTFVALLVVSGCIFCAIGVFYLLRMHSRTDLNKLLNRKSGWDCGESDDSDSDVYHKKSPSPNKRLEAAILEFVEFTSELRRRLTGKFRVSSGNNVALTFSGASECNISPHFDESEFPDLLRVNQDPQRHQAYENTDTFSNLSSQYIEDGPDLLAMAELVGATHADDTPKVDNRKELSKGSMLALQPTSPSGDGGSETSGGEYCLYLVPLDEGKNAMVL